MYLIIQMKEELKEILNTNKKVILIASDFSKIEEALAILDMHKDIKVLSVDDRCGQHENVQVITRDEEREILDLYYMYEFSDKFLALENSSQYGSVFDYVEEGIISFDEAIRSLIS